MSTRKSAAILLHDASLTALQVLDGGRLTLSFDGIQVYRRAARDLYDILTHSGKLLITGATNVLIRGSWTKGDDDYVLEEAIVNSAGEKIRWTDIADSDLQSIELLIFSGARIEIACTKAQLKLSQKGELTGRWEGPLFSETTS
jgi:hypothetical protein